MTRTGGWLVELGLPKKNTDPFMSTGRDNQNTRAGYPTFLPKAVYAVVPIRVSSTNCSVASSMARPRLPSA